MTRLRAVAVAVAIWIALLLVQGAGLLPFGAAGTTPGTSDPAIAAETASPSSGPTVTGVPRSAPPTSAPSPTPVPYTLHDEFDGTELRDVWGRHWPGFGASTWSRSQTRVRDGILRITARRQGSGFVSDLIDTVGTFEQRYGVFSARMRIPEGTGLWPAFWLAQPQNAAGQIAEIDIMEICANPPGTHRGNDVTLLHVYIHRRDGSIGYAERIRRDTFADGWHEYTLVWRRDLLTFLVDGVEVARLDDPAEIPDMKMAVVIDLAGGGRFCGFPNASTPATAVMEVDWVRVTR